MKKMLVCLLTLCILLTFAACKQKCEHEWYAATCTAPKTCSLCKLTEGEAAGHKWEAGNCTTDEKCAVCHEIKTEAPGHTWVEATTEAPKTCSVCNETEGTRLITDPRFTTESTKALYGTWKADAEITGEMMGIPDYPGTIACIAYYQFDNIGNAYAWVEVDNEEQFRADLKAYMKDALVTGFREAYGLSDAQIEEYMKSQYGMGVDAYVNVTVDEMKLEDLFGQKQEGVYYVGQNGIYMAEKWTDEEFDQDEFTVDGDTLTIKGQSFAEDGSDLVLTRVKES